MKNEMPTIKDIIAAQKHVYQHLKPTPLYDYPTLSELVGTGTWVKHENHQPVGAFGSSPADKGTFEKQACGVGSQRW